MPCVVAELGARVNEGDRKGNTPLMAAVRRGVGGGLDGMSFAAKRRAMVFKASTLKWHFGVNFFF